MMPKKKKNLSILLNLKYVAILLIEQFAVTLLMVSTIRFDFLVLKWGNCLLKYLLIIFSFHSDDSTQFSRHFGTNTNLNPPIECGVGPVSRGHALGFRFVSDGSNAKILDVSTYLIGIILDSEKSKWV